MDLIITKGKAASLFIAMSQSRKIVKKAFKKTRKNDLQTYDSIKTHLETNIDDLATLDDNSMARLLLSNNELAMLLDFIDWYVQGVEKVMLEAFNKIGEQDQVQFDNLRAIKTEIEVVIDA